MSMFGITSEFSPTNPVGWWGLQESKGSAGFVPNGPDRWPRPLKDAYHFILTLTMAPATDSKPMYLLHFHLHVSVHHRPHIESFPPSASAHLPHRV